MTLTPIIVFPSVNRKYMLHESVLCAVEQSVSGRIVISVPSEEHVLEETLSLPYVELLVAPIGSCAQRNAVLRRLTIASDVVVFFFDDDVELERTYIEKILHVFEQHPSVSLATGINLGTGASPGTLTRQIAIDLINSQHRKSPKSHIRQIRSIASCKMAMRGSLLGLVEFDEHLPLYGYLEDLDFSLQCKKFGQVVACEDCLMVHIEAATGRVGVKKRGYSEVINPIYIYKKRLGASLFRLVAGAIKRTFSNLFKLADVNRRRQLSGNLIGWRNVMRGRIDPEYVLKLRD